MAESRHGIPQELRCHRCSHAVGVSAPAMRLVGLFASSSTLRVPKADLLEVRKRCNACGWVNVFHPARPQRAIIGFK